MSQFPNVRSRVLNYSTDDKVAFNFFNAVYSWMAVGLALTAVVAYAASQSQAIIQMMYGSRIMVIACALGMMAIAMGVQSAALRISALAGTVLFLVYAGLMGLMISYIFIVYQMPVIGGAFLVTAGVFGGMSVYGFATKRDLTSMGSMLVMAFWGIFLASIVNIFIASDLLSWVVTYGVLFVVLGLVAYHTQMLKNIADQTRGNPHLAQRYAIIGSLILYISFINLFLSILRIMGGSNRR